jgi:hypothetical protein
MFASSAVYCVNRQAHKKLWALAVTSLFCLVFYISFASAEEIKNLVRNFDFEDGIVEWVLELHADQGAAATIGVDNKEAVTGKQSAIVETQKLQGGTWWHTGLNQNNHAVKAGTTYTLAFWAKAKSIRTINAGMGENHDPWGNWGFKEFSLDTEWKEYWTTWQSNVTDPNGRIRIATGTFKATVWVDHVRLYEGEYQKEDLSQSKPVSSKERLATTWGEIKSQ